MMCEIKRGDVVKLKSWEEVQKCLYNRRTPENLYVNDSMIKYFGGAHTVEKISGLGADESDT